MISVEEARQKILHGAIELPSEKVALANINGRIAAENILAAITQPPFAASAMDGYAVQFSDMKIGTALRVIGQAPAGAPFDGVLKAGEVVRIFTGAVVPEGADHILIQEDASRDGDIVTVDEEQDAPRHIRQAGIDFNEGDVLARKSEQLHEVHGSIFAAANISHIPVIRRPKVALFTNGDELVTPGSELLPGQIVNSNHYALTSLIQNWGGEVDYCGCASDSAEAIQVMFEKAAEADIVVPVGGASVGDHDYAKSVFEAQGGSLIFQKVAVRPGKPTWFGRLGPARVLGLPGNPASSIVTASLFLQPLVRKLAGNNGSVGFSSGRLTQTLPENGRRESYLRAHVAPSSDGFEITPATNQDSGLLLPFATANALIRRPIDASSGSVGDSVEFVRLR